MRDFLPPEKVYLDAVNRLLTERFGYPLSLSPKNIAQIRRWYKDDVPLAAVLDGVAQALNRKREGRLTPLSYCIKTVKTAAKRRSAP